MAARHARFVLEAAFASALAVLGAAASAEAQTSSKDLKAECDGKYYKAAAYAYLTGKKVDKPTWDDMFTTGKKKLELDKSPLEATLLRDSSDYRTAAFVSIPFTAVGMYARLVYTPVKNPAKVELDVCHFALKSSAKSWADFEVGDLKALFGRSFEAEKGAVSVRMGGSAPPSGHRESTVTVVWVTAFGDTPTIKLELRSEKK